MSQTFEFYDERAKEAEAAAHQSPLVMVRERELRSAAAWRDMANRALKVEATTMVAEARATADRVKADAVRAERRAAESAELAARAATVAG